MIQKVKFVHWLSMNDLLVLSHYYSIELHIIIDTVAVSLALLLAVFNAAGIIIISANDVLRLTIKLIACHW